MYVLTQNVKDLKPMHFALTSSVTDSGVLSFAKAQNEKSKMKEKQIEAALDVFNSLDSLASLGNPMH